MTSTIVKNYCKFQTEILIFVEIICKNYEREENIQSN